MGLDFKLRDFAHPLDIIRLKLTFDRNQWRPESELEKYQLNRLKIILTQAFQNVPYYKKLFSSVGLKPGDIRSISDLKKIPALTKDQLRNNFESLTAINSNRFQPRLTVTSGTTGGQVRFYMDKPANILEFVFYWRFWGWAGYRLGQTFAELSGQFFTASEKDLPGFGCLQKGINRLMVNSLLLSEENADEYIKLFQKFRPRFIKGLPSNLYLLARILGQKKDPGIHFRAIFSQGENLRQHQKELIEKVFSAPVYDYYGLMERTAAITQCPAGNYHVLQDYALVEFEETDQIQVEGREPDEFIAEVIGTSLYNMSMPLVRYRTGDYVKLKRRPEKCPCGRSFPTVSQILGREADLVVTPDGRYLTALYVAFDKTPGITAGQIIQNKIDEVLVRYCSESDSRETTGQLLEKNLREFLGPGMKIILAPAAPGEFNDQPGKKFKVVVSTIKNGTNMAPLW